MFFDGDELTILLKQEDIYIDSLKQRWDNFTLSPKAERDLRMGKRTELLGDLEASKIKAVLQAKRCQQNLTEIFGLSVRYEFLRKAPLV